MIPREVSERDPVVGSGGLPSQQPRCRRPRSLAGLPPHRPHAAEQEQALTAPHRGSHRLTPRLAEPPDASVVFLRRPIQLPESPPPHNVAGDTKRGRDLHVITW